jgi:hypothetical protein
MKKSFGYTQNKAEFDYNETKVYAGTYSIDEKPKPNPELLDTGYEFIYTLKPFFSKQQITLKFARPLKLKIVGNKM